MIGDRSEPVAEHARHGGAKTPGGVVSLSQNYANAWRLNDGGHVLTNRPDFNPMRQFG